MKSKAKTTPSTQKAEKKPEQPTKGFAVLNIPVGELGRSPFQHRTPEEEDSEDLKGLAASIAAVGVIQPLIVRRKADGASGYELICGHRRLEAAALAGLESVPCVVREPSDEVAQLANVIENLQRKDLAPLDEAEGVEMLTKTLKKTAPEIAKMLGVSERWVFRRRKLSRIVPAWRTIIREKNAGQEFCYALASVTQALQAILLKAPVTETLRPQDIGGSLWDCGARAVSNMPWHKEHPEWCKGCKKIMEAEEGNMAGLYWELQNCTLCGDPACREGKTRNFIEEVQASLKAQKLKPVLVKDATAIPKGGTVSGCPGQTVPYILTDGQRAGTVYWVDPRAEEKRADGHVKKQDKKNDACGNLDTNKKERARAYAQIMAIRDLVETKGEDVVSLRRALELAYLYLAYKIDDHKSESRGDNFLAVLNMKDDDLIKAVSRCVRTCGFKWIDKAGYIAGNFDKHEFGLEHAQLALTFGIDDKDIEKKMQEFANG